MRPGYSPRAAPPIRVTTTWCSTCERRHRDLQRPAPLRLDGPDRERQAGPRSLFRGPGARAARLRVRRRPPRARLRRAKPVGEGALLDQRIVAGLGNIYVCEALFRAGVDPSGRPPIADRYGKPNARADALVRGRQGECCTRRSRQAVGRCGTTDGGGTLGDFQHRFLVYGREGSRVRGCDGKIERIVQDGRSTFYCPSCQK